MNIKRFLDEKRISYKVYQVAETFDASHLASELRVPGDNVAKTVLVRANGGFRYYVIVAPASGRLDLAKLSHCLNDAHVQLATEFEIAERCPDCEFGLLPPFGSTFQADTIIDESLARHTDLFFRGDNHHEAVRITYQDFYNLEHPLVMPVTENPAEAPMVVDGGGRQ